MTIEIAPSVLSADFGRLREQVEEVRAAGARVIHVDVMDGHFVPPLSMGPPVCRALRDLDVHLEVHLMVERPERQVASFAEAGANTIIVHAEATPDVDYALRAVARRGLQGGPRGEPGDAAGDLRRGRGRPGALHERQSGLGRAGVHRAVDRPHRAPARDRRRRSGGRGRRRRRRLERRRVRGRRRDRGLSPAPPSSGRPTRLRRSRRSPPRRRPRSPCAPEHGSGAFGGR